MKPIRCPRAQVPPDCADASPSFAHTASPGPALLGAASMRRGGAGRRRKPRRGKVLLLTTLMKAFTGMLVLAEDLLPQTVPEPTAGAFFCLGVVGVVVLGRLRKR